MESHMHNRWSQTIETVKTFAPPKLLILMALLVGLGVPSARASIYSQTVINDAVAESLLDYKNDLQNVEMVQASAIHFLALVAFQDPSATNSSGTLVANRLVAQIRSLITGAK